jgi:hypothetical protein
MGTHVLRRLAGLQAGGEQVGDGIVEAGQVHGHPRPEEDDVAHQGLVLEGGPVGPGIALLPPGVGCLPSHTGRSQPLLDHLAISGTRKACDTWQISGIKTS